MSKNYDMTIKACFAAYIVQAVVNNFAPLLFVTFSAEYDIPISNITLLITFNFAVQLFFDIMSMTFVDRIGYRASMLLADILSAAGLVMLAFLPGAMGNHFAGLLISVSVYAVGGGLLEVLVNPILQACPGGNKEKAMSMLHSFYCWGHVGVVLISTAVFAVFGISSWRVLACVWAVLPAVNAVMFTRVPIAPVVPEGEKGMKLGELAGNRIFWLLVIMMLCSGASEQAVSQWASTFAELGLGVTKTTGDLAGPMMFATLMGLARMVYGKIGDMINLGLFMKVSCALCIAAYLCIGLIASPVVGLAACGLCGFSVGIMWPGTISQAAEAMPRGGTALFALLALAGDVGCTSGPTIAGFMSSVFGENLKSGILCAIIFPSVMMISLVMLPKVRGRKIKD